MRAKNIQRVSLRMGRASQAAVVGLAIVTLCVGSALSFLSAETEWRPTSGTSADYVGPNDSIAGYVDSLERPAAGHVISNSTQRYEDSVASMNDTLKSFKFRKVENGAFGVGERLVFDVNYGFITAGEAVMAVPAYDSVAGRKCYRVEFTVNSLPSFSWIYKVQDRYLTFIDIETIAPWKFEQHIREGTYRRDFIAEFDQRRHIARTSEGEYPIPEYVHDIMSAFYYSRTLDFSKSQPGDRIILHNFYKDKSHELQVVFLGRQELKVPAGTFRTVVVEPLVKEGGLFKSEGRIVIWLTDDERRIPVRVNSQVLIGSIDTELKSYSGLIGPLTARIE
jgi:hypothetical protein